ncbi:MAG: YitT family protein [Erysipelotrichia bacterium]|nr:YitT family protein [Erysipelotrichia bacterium]
MSKKFIKRMAVMIISGMIIGLGIAFFVSADLGADSMTTFEQGISKTFNIDLALCSIVANALFVVLTLFVQPKALTIPTLVYPLFISLGIKLADIVLVPVDSLPLRIVFMLLGLVTIGLGIGLGSNCNCGNNPYDGFVICLSEKFTIQFNYVRMVIDAVLLIGGILMQGSYGIGTIIAILLQGTIAQLFIDNLGNSDKLKKILEVE